MYICPMIVWEQGVFTFDGIILHQINSTLKKLKLKLMKFDYVFSL